eukprot:scaffold64590_cov61-Phaeocystis_antarctica.AAC.6
MKAGRQSMKEAKFCSSSSSNKHSSTATTEAPRGLRSKRASSPGIHRVAACGTSVTHRVAGVEEAELTEVSVLRVIVDLGHLYEELAIARPLLDRGCALRQHIEH